eukprot:3822745-Prymnesium_polylepis.1
MEPSPQRPSQTGHRRPTCVENAPLPQDHAYPAARRRRRPVVNTANWFMCSPVLWYRCSQYMCSPIGSSYSSTLSRMQPRPRGHADAPHTTVCERDKHASGTRPPTPRPIHFRPGHRIGMVFSSGSAVQGGCMPTQLLGENVATCDV